MKIVRACVGLSAGAVLCGCISFTMDESDQWKTIERPNYTQISSTSVSGVEPTILEWGAAENPGYHSGLFKIKLYATGDFVVHEGAQTEHLNLGRRTLTVGFLPGAAVEGNPSMNAATVVFMSPLMNFAFVLIPTMSSLFCEPFRDYSLPAWASGSQEFGFNDAGLIGFRKHYKGGERTPSRQGFRETGSHQSHRVGLYGYALSIDGKHYKSESDGCVSLYHPRRGQHLQVTVVEAPSVRADSEDRIQELEGVEFEIVVP